MATSIQTITADTLVKDSLNVLLQNDQIVANAADKAEADAAAVTDKVNSAGVGSLGVNTGAKSIDDIVTSAGLNGSGFYSLGADMQGTVPNGANSMYGTLLNCLRAGSQQGSQIAIDNSGIGGGDMYVRYFVAGGIARPWKRVLYEGDSTLFGNHVTTLASDFSIDSLSNLTDVGVYCQNLNAAATVANGYPSLGHAGSLLVLPTAYNVQQVYIPFSSEGIWLRGRTSSGTWTAWKQINHWDNIAGKPDVWAMQPIGVPIPIYDWISNSLIPPSNNSSYRYIKLSASSSYNSGILTNETVSGSAPNISAVATVNLAGSLFDGVQVRLLNSEARFLRPGESGAQEESAYGSHSHTATSDSQGNHAHSISDPGHAHGVYDPGHAHVSPANLWNGPGSLSMSQGGNVVIADNWSTTNGTGIGIYASGTGIGINATGAHAHNVTINSAGSNETRPRSIRVPLYMRIK